MPLPRTRIHPLTQSLLDVLLPRTCASCGASGAWHCPRCRTGPAPCAVARGGFPVLLAQEPPDSAAVAALYALKYRSERDAADPLASLIAHALASALRTSAGVVLVPVPTDARRARARGFDQATLLASAVGGLLGIPVCSLLWRSRLTAPQVGLDARARRTNLAGAFTVVDRPQARTHYLLVDDVVTTGATLREAAAALADAGAGSLGAVALFGRTA